MRMKNFYIISDTHFNHMNLINRGFRPENFQEMILSNLENMVTKDDILIHLGDLTWAKNIEERFLALPSKKILVKGNHDFKSYMWYMNHGFDFAAESFSLIFNDTNFIFSHKPIQLYHDYDFNIHGHLHTGTLDDYGFDNKKYYLISLENNGYKPESLNDIIGYIKKHGKGNE